MYSEEFDEVNNRERSGEDVYSKPVRAGKRTYFFDVKSTKGNDYYLTITESKRKVEKDGKTASSEYSRGDSFGLHKNLSIYNSYRIGRLGAKPELGSIFLDYEE